ncbi:MAG: cysteine desulfurase family protein [Bacillota bacterium]|nr:MAG: cysteine desulfurase NifS [Bacillota bacterium]
MRRVYADHAATTPVHPRVAEAMVAAMQAEIGNPSSVHGFGRAARRLVEEARARVAALIGASPQEIFFTSGGTEADNWALRGTLMANRARGRHLVVSAIEHHAVLDCAAALEREGWEVTYLPVDSLGRVREEDLLAALRPDTVLVSIMHTNNEVGTVQDIPRLCALVKERDPNIVFHTDAVQAAGILPLDVKALGVDLLTISAHKIYGPKGVGALYARQGFRFAPILFGGGQERKMRPGTENLPGIVGFGVAAEIAREELPRRAEHARRLRDRFLKGVLERIPGVRVSGPNPLEDTVPCHPGIANIAVQGVESEALLLALDLQGVAASSGSACTAGSLEPSHVIRALGLPPEYAAGAMRFSFGEANTEEDIDYLLEVLPQAVAQVRGV